MRYRHRIPPFKPFAFRMIGSIQATVFSDRIVNARSSEGQRRQDLSRHTKPVLHVTDFSLRPATLRRGMVYSC